jgi:hypothetical protein
MSLLKLRAFTSPWVWLFLWTTAGAFSCGQQDPAFTEEWNRSRRNIQSLTMVLVREGQEDAQWRRGKRIGHSRY